MDHTDDKIRIHNHDAALIALFGSIKNYRESDILRELNERIAYLKNIKSLLVIEVKREGDAVQWWNLYSKLTFFIAFRYGLPVILKEADELIEKYSAMRSLPVKFFVKELNDHCDKFYNSNKRIFTYINIGPYKYEARHIND